MSDNVTLFPGAGDGLVGDGLAIDVDQVLDAAKGSLQVVVVAYDKDGELTMFASHGSRDTLWLLRRGEIHLLTETE